MTFTIGVDIGGSSATAVAIDEAGEVVHRYRVNGRIEGGRQVVASALAAIRSFQLEDCVAIGVGVPGLVDSGTGQVTMAVNLGIGAHPYPLAAEIGEALDFPVTIENDVRAAALGAHESMRLAGDPPDSLAMVSIGTGISAGVVVRGDLIRGIHGMAGEIGHVVVDESAALCRCGQRGCLEAVASGPAIDRAWPKGLDGNAATALFAAAAGGDPAAEKVAGRIAGYLTMALTWLAAAYDTERIVIGGGVSDAGDTFLSAIRDRINRQAALSDLAARRLSPEQVTLAQREDPPGPRGAAVIAARSLLTHGLSTGREAPARTQATNAK
jgi:predicted NBD/HSP70 family sugar kinase